jgi:hypothetical protein
MRVPTRIINPNATPGSYVASGCHYLPAPMPYFMEFRKYVGLHAGYLAGYLGERFESFKLAAPAQSNGMLY